MVSTMRQRLRQRVRRALTWRLGVRGGQGLRSCSPLLRPSHIISVDERPEALKHAQAWECARVRRGKRKKAAPED